MWSSLMTRGALIVSWAIFVLRGFSRPFTESLTGSRRWLAGRRCSSDGSRSPDNVSVSWSITNPFRSIMFTDSSAWPVFFGFSVDSSHPWWKRFPNIPSKLVFGQQLNSSIDFAVCHRERSLLRDGFFFDCETTRLCWYLVNSGMDHWNWAGNERGWRNGNAQNKNQSSSVKLASTETPNKQNLKKTAPCRRSVRN